MINYRLLALLILIQLLFAFQINAQLPKTDIYFLKIIQNADQFTIDACTMISNGKVYNNQPWFTSDCKSLLYTSSDSTGQTDIKSFNLKNSKTSVLLKNKLSEYSPTINLKDGSLNFVRVEQDKKQHLYKYDLKTGIANQLIPESDSIGYYTFFSPSDLAVIVLNGNLQLKTYNLYNHQLTKVADNTGRLVLNDQQNDRILFTLQEEGDSLIYSYNTINGNIRPVTKVLPGAKDYAIDKQGYIYAGAKGVLFRRKINMLDDWKAIYDLNACAGKFYRLAFCSCGKHMAVVSYSGDLP